jgi:hypothetical protein
MSKDYSLAVSQITRIEQLCDFLDHPGLDAAIKCSVPVSMPQSEGSLGFDTPLWIGLGLVGLWSALDAYAERSGYSRTPCETCGRNCLPGRLASTGRLDRTSQQVLGELEDIRHLFAHNFAGHADSTYFSKKQRHYLCDGSPVRFLSEATFDGTNIALTAKHLRFYAGQSRKILFALTDLF